MNVFYLCLPFFFAQKKMDAATKNQNLKNNFSTLLKTNNHHNYCRMSVDDTTSVVFQSELLSKFATTSISSVDSTKVFTNVCFFAIK